MEHSSKKLRGGSHQFHLHYIYVKDIRPKKKKPLGLLSKKIIGDL